MNDQQQEEVLKALRDERDELGRELSALEVVITRFERRVSSPIALTSLPAQPVKVNDSESSTDVVPFALTGSAEFNKGSDGNFPKSSNIEKQLVYVLNRLKKAQRYPELQVEYTKLSGSKRNIRKDLTDLRRKGSLIAIKYNNNFSQVFQGLPEWVTPTENGPLFKPEFIEIDASKFPTGIWKSESMEEDKT